MAADLFSPKPRMVAAHCVLKQQGCWPLSRPFVPGVWGPFTPLEGSATGLCHCRFSRRDRFPTVQTPRSQPASAYYWALPVCSPGSSGTANAASTCCALSRRNMSV